MARATFGGGCFWCVEAAFKELDGVEAVTSGYAGGDQPDPTYEAVCRGDTGHAEVVQVEYDPTEITYEDLLTVFFRVHDPTTEDREGPDIGPQYRSIVLHHDDNQRETLEQFIESLEDEGVYEDPIVTERTSLETFYPAEEHHQDYFEKNPLDAYCRLHAEPKVAAVQESFPDLTSE